MIGRSELKEAVLRYLEEERLKEIEDVLTGLYDCLYICQSVHMCLSLSEFVAIIICVSVVRSLQLVPCSGHSNNTDQMVEQLLGLRNRVVGIEDDLGVIAAAVNSQATNSEVNSQATNSEV